MTPFGALCRIGTTELLKEGRSVQLLCFTTASYLQPQQLCTVLTDAVGAKLLATNTEADELSATSLNLNNPQA